MTVPRFRPAHQAGGGGAVVLQDVVMMRGRRAVRLGEAMMRVEEAVVVGVVR